MPRRLRILPAVLLALALPAPAQAAVVWAVGDGGVAEPDDDRVADRIQHEGIDRLLYLGDVYETGTAAEFRDNFAPSFGRFRDIGHPTPGNHEWARRAEGYDPFWGARAPRNDGAHAYAFELEGWRFVSLNSEEDTSATSPQVRWLQRELAGSGDDCTVAFWHKPRYAAGREAAELEPFWSVLAGRARLALTGHEHNYQRLHPERGITPITVGTGGRFRYAIRDPADPRLAFGDDDTFGALRMDVRPGRIDWAFVAVDGRRLDQGTTTCSRPATAPAPVPSPTAPPPAPSSSPSGASRADVIIDSPRDRARHTRRLRLLRGRALVPAGARTGVVLTRRIGRACRAWDGRAFRARCTRAPLTALPSTFRWQLRFLARPRAGRYRLVSVVTGAGGRVLARDAHTFRIR